MAGTLETSTPPARRLRAARQAKIELLVVPPIIETVPMAAKGMTATVTTWSPSLAMIGTTLAVTSPRPPAAE